MYADMLCFVASMRGVYHTLYYQPICIGWTKLKSNELNHMIILPSLIPTLLFSPNASLLRHDTLYHQLWDLGSRLPSLQTPTRRELQKPTPSRPFPFQICKAGYPAHRHPDPWPFQPGAPGTSELGFM